MQSDDNVNPLLLARMYRDGKGVEQDIKQAIEWMRKSADMCAYEFIDLLMVSESTENYSEAFSLAMKLADQGDGQAMLRLSRMYRDGKGVEQDIDLAIEWMRQSMPYAELIAKDHLCRFYTDLLLISLDKKKWKEAFTICKKHSSKSDGWYRETLIQMYLSGVGTKKNNKEARLLMKQCKYYRESYVLEPLRKFNGNIYAHSTLVVLSSDPHLNQIVCSCIQNNVYIDYVVDVGETDTKIPIFLKKIGYESMKSFHDPAIITSFVEYDELRKKNSNLLEYSIFIYPQGVENETDSDINSLLVVNPNIKDIVVLTDECKVLSKLEENGLDVKAVFSTDEIDLLIEEYKKSLKSGEKYRIFVETKDEQSWEKICVALVSKGIEKDVICLDVEKNITNFSKIMHFERFVKQITLDELEYNYALGERIYNELPCKRNEVYLHTSFSPMGDQYRILCKARAHSKTHGINTKVIVSKSARDILELFSYEGIVLDAQDKIAISTYLQISKETEKVIFLDAPTLSGVRHKRFLVPHGPARLTRDIYAGYLGAFPCFDDVFYPTRIQPPELFHNSVLINPYGNYVNRFPELRNAYTELFQKIASGLISKGVRVFTNSIDDSQPPLPDTEILRYSMKDLFSICRDFKMIISTFTGFMEALILAECRLTVISPNKRESRLWVAELSNKCEYVEHILDETKIDQIAEKIISEVMSVNSPHIHR